MQFSANKSLLSRKGRRVRKRGETKRDGANTVAAQSKPLTSNVAKSLTFSNTAVATIDPQDDAKLRREERKVARERAKMATKLQSFFRGRLVAYKTLKTSALRLYKKVNDLKLLVEALALKKKILLYHLKLFYLCADIYYLYPNEPQDGTFAAVAPAEQRA